MDQSEIFGRYYLSSSRSQEWANKSETHKGRQKEVPKRNYIDYQKIPGPFVKVDITALGDKIEKSSWTITPTLDICKWYQMIVAYQY